MTTPSKRALITGITGQDGSYLAEHLLGLGYEVHGLVRRVALEDPQRRFTRLGHLLEKITLHPASLESYPSIFHVLSKHNFDECYHLAAQSFVAESFTDGFSTMNTNINGTHYMLAALRELRPECRFYFAGSSEMFGKVRETPQNEDTPFHPRSPYGAAKVFGHYTTVNYREAYGLHASSGICFNHESPRRGLEFVTRKVTNSMARIKLGLQEKITLGNLDSSRDWGFAGDYVDAMWRMLQQPEPGDFVIAMGETHTNRELLDVAARVAGFDDWHLLVQQDERFMRPAEVDILTGDAGKARRQLDWQPRVTFEELVQMMYENDLKEEQARAAASRR